MPLCLRHVGIGAGEQEDVVGVLRLGRPHLLAVDDPFVAVELGPGLERGEVAAGVGLGEALAPRDLAARGSSAGRALLLLGAPLAGSSARRGCRRRSRPAWARSASGELLVQHDALHERQPSAAVLLRPRGADPAALGELRVHSALKLARSSAVMLEPGLPQPSGRFSSSQSRISRRNASASGGYVRSMARRYRRGPAPARSDAAPAHGGGARRSSRVPRAPELDGLHDQQDDHGHDQVDAEVHMAAVRPRDHVGPLEQGERAASARSRAASAPAPSARPPAPGPAGRRRPATARTTTRSLPSTSRSTGDVDLGEHRGRHEDERQHEQHRHDRTWPPRSATGG